MLQDLRPIAKRSEAFPPQFQEWISGMLSGASNLRRVCLDVELLPCLPLSQRKVLKSLHLDACITQARAVPDVVQALMECQQLEELNITCSNNVCGLEIPVLDLRHLVGLRRCVFNGMPAPGDLLLSRGELDLCPSLDQLAAWSKLQHEVQDHVLYMDIFMPSTVVLKAWPQGIGAFRNIKFLQIDSFNVGPSADDGILDLAHFAYIPYVSLSCYRLSIRISTGYWKILDIHSGTFSVAFDDVKAFMKSIGAFSFKFASKDRPEDLIKKLKQAEADTGIALYEHLRSSSASWVVLSNIKPGPNDVYHVKDMFIRARIRHAHPK